MSRYQLLRILDIAGEVDGRKRMQKMAFLLQCNGLQLDYDFVIHHYGPYSFDLANEVTLMTRGNLVEEREEQLGQAKAYRYSMSSNARSQLQGLTAEPRFKSAEHELAVRSDLIKRLAEEDLWTLELGSTIAYFQRKSGDWEEAIQAACVVKGRAPEDADVQKAFAFVQELVA